MIRIMSDNDVLGQVGRLMDICQAPPWAELWHDLECTFCTFDDFALPNDAADAVIWRTWQDNEIILITGNRNADDPESLETTIGHQNTANSLPVLTLADPERVLRDRPDAEMAVERLFDIFIDVDSWRGTGRLFLP